MTKQTTDALNEILKIFVDDVDEIGAEHINGDIGINQLNKSIELLIKDNATATQSLIDKEVQAGKYKVLGDLLEWHDNWRRTHTIASDPFNWYGAVKSMFVMKTPQKPFHELAQRSAPDSKSSTELPLERSEVDKEIVRARKETLTSFYEWVQSEGRIYREIKAEYEDRIASLNKEIDK